MSFDLKGFMLIRSVIIGVAVIGFGLSDFEFISLNFVQFVFDWCRCSVNFAVRLFSFVG